MMRRLLSALLVVVLSVLTPAAASPQKRVDDRTRREAARAFERGRELMSAEQFEKAADAFTDAVKLDPLFVLAHYQLGQANMNLHRYASAIKAFKDCVDASRTLYSMMQTDRFEAERQRDDEIREARETVALLQRTGRTLQAARAQDYLTDLETKRSSIDPEFRPSAEVLLSLGSAYFRNGDREQAEAEWKAATEVNPRFGEAYSNLAVVYMTTGRKKEAEQAIKSAEKSGLRVNPQLKKDIAAMRP